MASTVSAFFPLGSPLSLLSDVAVGLLGSLWGPLKSWEYLLHSYIHSFLNILYIYIHKYILYIIQMDL